MTLTPDCDTETLPADCAGLILVGGMSWAMPEAERIVPLVREALSHGILVGAICNAASFLAAHGFLNGVKPHGNSLRCPPEWGGANYTGEKLYQERQAVRDCNVVTANGSGYLEFTRECLLALRSRHAGANRRIVRLQQTRILSGMNALGLILPDTEEHAAGTRPRNQSGAVAPRMIYTGVCWRLVRMLRPRRILLEIGTFTGYSGALDSRRA